MSTPELYLFDDAKARAWQPFALTRPAGELLFGCATFRRRAEHVFGVPCAGHVTSEHLRGFAEPDAAPVVDVAAIPTNRPRIFISARAVLDAGQPWTHPPGRASLSVADEVVGCFLPAGEANPAADWFGQPQPLAEAAAAPLPGRLLQRVWDLVSGNAEQIIQDFRYLSQENETESDVARIATIGYQPGLLRTGTDVTIEPGVVLDFTAGPIWLDRGVTVRAFTRLSGPAYVGPGSTLLGGPYAAISVGPVCRIHGEVEESVVLGYSNKAHDGFLGHAYLGRWVNLGAMTTNSDLKNNYGQIRMWTPDGEQNTGLIKIGSLLGDYVKTGIGALLNTGTVIGAGSNLYGTDMPPKYVPPFSWGSGDDLVAFDVDKFLQVTETVMKRRSLDMSEGMRDMLRAAWEAGRAGSGTESL